MGKSLAEGVGVFIVGSIIGLPTWMMCIISFCIPFFTRVYVQINSEEENNSENKDSKK